MSGSKCRPLLQHLLKLEKNCPIYFPDFNLESFFLLKNMFIMKSLNGFCKMVKTSVDLVPLRLTLQLPEYLLQIPQVVFHVEEAAAWLVSAYYYQKMLMNVVILCMTSNSTKFYKIQTLQTTSQFNSLYQHIITIISFFLYHFPTYHIDSWLVHFINCHNYWNCR